MRVSNRWSSPARIIFTYLLRMPGQPHGHQAIQLPDVPPVVGFVVVAFRNAATGPRVYSAADDRVPGNGGIPALK